MRQGEVTILGAVVVNTLGEPIDGAEVSWSVDPGAGGVVVDGVFVGYAPGQVRLVGRSGALADTVQVTVVERGVAGSLTKLGEGVETGRFTSDVWVHGDHAYSGTRFGRVSAGDTLFGDRLFVWNVVDAANPIRVGELPLDARVVNDVKVRADGAIAVATHEGSADGLNGITILDLTDPSSPTPLARFTDGMETGVHNVWVEGDFVYAAVDGDGGLRIVDITDPALPTPAGSFVIEGHRVHDVYVRDGLAFVSHWDAGLVILDVGNGWSGGSPADPRLVSAVPDLDGQTHNAWYWPAAGYVFVGEEDFEQPGVVHVVDARDLGAPAEVATFALGQRPPHNFWVDEDRGLLFVAWYGEGLQVIDVNGALLGALDRQGRRVAGSRYNGGSGACDTSAGTATCSWGPQLHRGVIWVSDINRGIVALELTGGPGPEPGTSR